MSLTTQSTPLLTALVDERYLEQLQLGQSATVLADAYPGQRFTAKVEAISPLVDAQRGAIEVKFAVTGTAPAFLREDMTLSVEVETAKRDRALVLPVNALRTNDATKNDTPNSTIVYVAPADVAAVVLLEEGAATVARSASADRVPIGVLSAALRMPTLAATAAPPATTMAAMDSAVTTVRFFSMGGPFRLPRPERRFCRCRV